MTTERFPLKHALVATITEPPPESPIADVARELETAERHAPPIADLPFALTPEASQRKTKQGGLF